tara:strand:- start:3559 stop:4488 length:930 start_codon:yes stop_codon:yes gene_type:complete
MKIVKPKFWSKKNSFFSLLLLPISFFLQILNKIKQKITVEKIFKIPIICVGNIYLGGTGKTPLSIMIAKELIRNKKKPAIIKKFYSEHTDEHNLIKDNINCLFLNKQRSAAINNAEKEKYDVAILDDGFQDFSIKKNMNILCFNSKQLIGNGMTLPSGPLRENMNAIKKAHIVVINGNKNELFENKILNISNKIKIFYSKYSPSNIDEFKNKKLLAFAGIGNPNNFFELLEENNLDLKKKYAFPDHYEFNKSEILQMLDLSIKNNFQPITTEKDYYRIKKYGFKNIKFLKIKLEIFEKEKFIKHILNYL